MAVLKFSRNVYMQMMEALRKTPPECGGILGAKEGGIITEFYFDRHGTSSENGYVPNVEEINEMLIRDWMPRGILMVGIVHSHSNGNEVPSCGDLRYGVRILQALDTVDQFYLPIFTVKNGQPLLTCYGIYPDPVRQFVCRKIDCKIYDDPSAAIELPV